MIRWITPFLGTAPASQVVLEDDMRLLDVRDLVDKFGNSPGEVRKKVEAGVDLLNKGCRLVVACDYGISRSNSIAIGVLSAYENISFDEAAYRVVQTTGEQEIKLGPLNAVRAALNATSSSAPQGARILVTGGTGFIGRNFLAQYKDELTIFAPPRSEIDLMKGATLLDLYIKKNAITHFVHLANPRIYTSNRAMGEAITMMRNVLEVCSENSLHLVFLSSHEIYFGHKADAIAVDEKTEVHPKGPFGETKWICEEMIGLFRETCNLKCTVLRVPFVYGAGADRPKFLWNFIAKAKAGEPIYTHVYENTKPTIDLLNVKDLNSAIKLVLTLKICDDFQLGTAKIWPTDEIAKLVCRKLRSKSLVNHLSVNDTAVNVTMDNTRVRNQLNWNPHIPFSDGLNELIEGIDS